MNLSGKLLIAMPGMGDPRFEQSVVYLCAHSQDGAMGLIVNKPIEDLRFSDLLEQLGIPPGPGRIEVPVHAGGPVEHGRGFVLHSAEYRSKASTLRVDDTFGMTSTLDILEDLAAGRGPDAALLALGYSGWGPGQLESEIGRNGWLTCDASRDIVFNRRDEGKWRAALTALGIDAHLLSSTSGRA